MRDFLRAYRPKMGCSSPSSAYADTFEGHRDLLRNIIYSPDLLACKLGSCKSVTPHTEPSMLCTTLASGRRPAQYAVMEKLFVPTTSGLLGFARASRFAKPFFHCPDALADTALTHLCVSAWRSHILRQAGHLNGGCLY